MHQAIGLSCSPPRSEEGDGNEGSGSSWAADASCADAGGDMCESCVALRRQLVLTVEILTNLDFTCFSARWRRRRVQLMLLKNLKKK